MAVWGPDPDYLYHGTGAQRLASIARHGLVPAGGPATAPGVSRTCYVYFSPRLGEAAAYASERFRRPAVLRVRKDALEGPVVGDPWFTPFEGDPLASDPMAGAVCVEERIPPEHLEVCEVEPYAGDLGPRLVLWQAGLEDHCAGRWRRLR